MSEPRVIKKYPNRRLYDTVESRYITLADVRKLVVERIDFVVVIAELEQAGEPLMSRDFLSQIIRSHDGPFHDMIGSYLEQSFRLFASHQRDVRERTKNAVDADPFAAVANLAQKNYQRWRSVQDEISRTLMNAASAGRGASAGDDASAEIRPLP